jgi:hypothetical protein
MQMFGANSIGELIWAKPDRSPAPHGAQPGVALGGLVSAPPSRPLCPASAEGTHDPAEHARSACRSIRRYARHRLACHGLDKADNDFVGAHRQRPPPAIVRRCARRNDRALPRAFNRSSSAVPSGSRVSARANGQPPSRRSAHGRMTRYGSALSPMEFARRSRRSTRIAGSRRQSLR